MGGIGGREGFPTHEKKEALCFDTTPPGAHFDIMSMLNKSAPCDYQLPRYEYEDRLILGLVGPQKVQGGEEAPLVQPLNFRLPVSFHCKPLIQFLIPGFQCKPLILFHITSF